jgi:hypothetical protein
MRCLQDVKVWFLLSKNYCLTVHDADIRIGRRVTLLFEMEWVPSVMKVEEDRPAESALKRNYFLL